MRRTMRSKKARESIVKNCSHFTYKIELNVLMDKMLVL
jgi:hypothetical protein